MNLPFERFAVCVLNYGKVHLEAFFTLIVQFQEGYSHMVQHYIHIYRWF